MSSRWKASLTSSLTRPVIAVPTTYAGSEMTPIWGLTEDGLKRTGRDPRVLPKTVLYDPELTTSLPPQISGPSGMNAIAHCVEALYAKDGDPIISLMAEDGMRALGRSLPQVVAEPAGGRPRHGRPVANPGRAHRRRTDAVKERGPPPSRRLAQEEGGPRRATPRPVDRKMSLAGKAAKRYCRSRPITPSLEKWGLENPHGYAALPCHAVK